MAAPVIHDTTVNPIIVQAGKTASPFKAITVDDAIGLTETTDILYASSSMTVPFAQLGTLTDPAAGLTSTLFSANVGELKETALVTGAPTPATTILGRVVYTAPTLADGKSLQLITGIAVSNPATTQDFPPGSPVIDVVTPPAITGTAANQPVAAGNAIRPLATLAIDDENFNPTATATGTATITITDGGAPTDADGLLTGAGLSKTGVGTYALTSDVSIPNLQDELRSLSLATASVTSTAAFEVDVTDTKAKLTGKDTTTSVMIIGTPGTAPQIAGTVAGQTVASGNTINPFSTVSISDSAGAQDTVKITLTGGDANGKLSGNGITETAPGVYTLAAAPPATLNGEVDGLVFTPTGLPAGTPTVTTGMQIDVTNTTNKLTGTDAKTTVIEQTPPPQTGNFLIGNQTTGQQSAQAGDPYTGPVPGLQQEIILITKDNLNIKAQIPNVFIHTGSGNDAIDVSGVNGNNILDGFTGTNFLTGGLGLDTFYVDDRNATSDIFSTIKNFHTGDNTTVWGITKTNVNIATGNDVLPSAPGLDFAFTATGKPSANLNIPGFSTADLTNGKLTVTFGHTQDTPGLPGSDFMLIHAN
jgi:hypothetical protein